MDFTFGVVSEDLFPWIVMYLIGFIALLMPEPFAAVFDIPAGTRQVSSALSFGEIKKFLRYYVTWEYEIVQEDEAKKQLVILTTATRFSPRSRCFLSIQERGEGKFQVSIHKRYRYASPRLDILDQFAALFEGAKV